MPHRSWGGFFCFGFLNAVITKVKNAGREYRILLALITPIAGDQGLPTPAEAITGTLNGLTDRARYAKSKPFFVPSRSILLGGFLPAPYSIHFFRHSTAV